MHIDHMLAVSKARTSCDLTTGQVGQVDEPRGVPRFPRLARGWPDSERGCLTWSGARASELGVARRRHLPGSSVTLAKE